MSSQSPLRQILSRYKRGVTLASLLTFSSILILFNGTPGVSKPQEIGLTVFSFFQGLISQSANWFGSTTSSIGDLTNLQQKYQEAKQQLERYVGTERTLIDLKEEVRHLREQLQFHETLPISNVPVEVIGRDPSKVYSSIVVNKGYLDGIRKNMPVVAYQNKNYGLVGKIAEVGLSTAIVQPIVDGNLFIAARFLNTRYEGLVSGKGNNEESLVMQYVKKRAKDEIRSGDLIVTAGLDSIYPKDLLIGRVKAFTSLEYENSLEVEIEPVIQFSRLEYLNVLRTQE